MKLYKDSRYELSSSYDIQRYILGGRGVVTLEAPSGKSHTYAYLKPRNSSEFPDDVIFVYAVHDNIKLFYIGMIERLKFRLTYHSRFLEDTEIVRGAKYIMHMARYSHFKSPMKLYHEGMCCRCGRKLTTTKSKQCGIGPKCRKLISKSNGDSVC